MVDHSDLSKSGSRYSCRRIELYIPSAASRQPNCHACRLTNDQVGFEHLAIIHLEQYYIPHIVNRLDLTVELDMSRASLEDPHQLAALDHAALARLAYGVEHTLHPSIEDGDPVMPSPKELARHVQFGSFFGTEHLLERLPARTAQVNRISASVPVRCC